MIFKLSSDYFNDLIIKNNSIYYRIDLVAFLVIISFLIGIIVKRLKTNIRLIKDG